METLDVPAPLSTSEVVGQPPHEKIAARAYERYQERGGTHGYDLDDWLDADREVYDEESMAGKGGQRRLTHADTRPAPGARRKAY